MGYEQSTIAGRDAGTDGGAASDAGAPSADAGENDAGKGPPDDAGEGVDAGPPGPCTPDDCIPLIKPQLVGVPECASGEAPVCARATDGLCEHRCPEIPPERVCGGLKLQPASDCDDSSYCRFDFGTCGELTEQGACTERPLSCSEDISTVCGCDGVTYDHPCAAAALGVNLRSTGPCF